MHSCCRAGIDKVVRWLSRCDEEKGNTDALGRSVSGNSVTDCFDGLCKKNAGTLGIY
jgi:hypothetical protein